MKTDNVTSARKLRDSSIELTITDPFEKTTCVKRYAAIRGGISWPTMNSPAFFCVVAQEYVELQDGVDTVQNGRRVLLAEHEHKSASLNRFYNRVADIADQFMCHNFYVEIPEIREDCGFISDFDKSVSGRDSKPYMADADDADNFILGVSRIQDSTNSGELIIPDESITVVQLRSFEKKDLENSPEERFFAINALRHVIGSFYRYPVRLHIPSRIRPPINWRVA